MQEKGTPAREPAYTRAAFAALVSLLKGGGMDEKTIKAILSALAAGHRVQLKQLRDGTIKIQVVSQKELKIT